MNGIIAAALPVFGLLACLFLGFMLLSSESRSGERFAYVFFGVGVAWLIASGTVLWPKVSHAGLAPVSLATQKAEPTSAPAVAPARYYYGYPVQAPYPYYGYGYGYSSPYSYAYPGAYGYAYGHGYGYGYAPVPANYGGYRQTSYIPNGYYR